MKYNFIQCAVVFATFLITTKNNAQDMWGTTSFHNNKDGGAIFRADEQGVIKEYFDVFPFIDGRNPYNVKLIEASPNVVYGTTRNGGDSGLGTIFKFDLITKKLTSVHHFGDKIGYATECGLMKASNGKLYGVTRNGGTNDQGVFYEFDPINEKYKVLIHFEKDNNGKQPIGLPMQAANGKIYGTAYGGGSNNLGIIYSYDILTNSMQTVYSFNNTNGNTPMGNLVEYNNFLYGSASNGGANDDGVLFSFNISNATYSVLHSFVNATDGSSPEYLLEKNGMLFGNCKNGGSYGGTIFKYNIANPLFSTMHMFTASTGRYPSQLSDLNNGYFYGVTQQGGANNFGVFYKLNIATGSITIIEDFVEIKGRYTVAGILKATNGKYYFSSNGGVTSNGNILEYDTVANQLNTILSFEYAPKGARPVGKLLQIYGDKFLGMTTNGGDNNLGTIFQWDAGSKTMSVLHHISNIEGSNYYGKGGLIKASNGKIYGIMRSAGKFGYGTAFSYNLSNNSIDTIKSFRLGDALGTYPGSQLIEKNGFLYGLNVAGGANNKGTIFKIDIQTNAISLVFAFTDSTGYDPASMFLANNGKLYGNNQSGGLHGDGTFWEYDFTTQIAEKLFSFKFNTTGRHVYSILEPNANELISVCAYGGSSNGGVLFKYDILNKSFAKLYDFVDTISGNYANNELHLANNGNIYGMCSNGGPSRFDAGTLFEWNMQTNKLSVKSEFNYNEGHFPEDCGLVQTKILNIQPQTSKVDFCNLYPNPAKNDFTIQSNDALSALIIMDMQGKTIVEQAINGQREFEMNIAYLSKGLYIANIVAANGSTQVIKFNKQ